VSGLEQTSGGVTGVTGQTKRFIAGIDIGGTKILLLLADENGAILDKKKVPTPSKPAPAQLFRFLAEQLDESLAKMGADRTALAGVGIGLPGVVDFREGVADNCTALGWGKVDVRAGMRFHVDCPIYVENDVKISAYGEWWRGAAQGVDDFFMMAIGTGIGSAVMSGGQIMRGSGFASGEVGYFVLDDSFPDDFRQDYTTFGSLESLASGPAITARARKAVAAHKGPTLLTGHFGATADTVRADQVFQAAGEGDALALDILRLPLRQLAMTIANVASLLNPALVVIGGGVADSAPYFLDLLQKQAQRLTPNPVKLVAAQLANEAGAAGAVYLASRTTT
jgi:glucokinase